LEKEQGVTHNLAARQQIISWLVVVNFIFQITTSVWCDITIRVEKFWWVKFVLNWKLSLDWVIEVQNFQVQQVFNVFTYLKISKRKLNLSQKLTVNKLWVSKNVQNLISHNKINTSFSRLVMRITAFINQSICVSSLTVY